MTGEASGWRYSRSGGAIPKAKAGPDGAPLPAGLRFIWKDDDDEGVEVEVLPGDGRRYRARMKGRRWVEGTATLDQLRAWHEARL